MSAVEQARNAVERIAQVTHEFSCARVKKVRGKWVIDRLVKCNCGESDKGNATIDALIAAVRAEERERCVWIVKQSQEVFVPMSMRVGRNDERYIDATELLSRLTGGPHE